MEWLNLHTSVLDSPEFVLSTDAERSTWLCLLRFCAGQENGGIIKDAAGWSDRQWQQLARVGKRTVRSMDASLWKWEGNDLHVFRYPAGKENEVRQNRENGRKGGRPPKNQLDNRPVNHPVIETKNPQETTRLDSAETEGERKGKGKEGKDKGKEKGRGTEPPAEQTKESEARSQESGGEANRARPRSLSEVDGYFAPFGAPKAEAEKFFNHYTANGWRVGKAPMCDWRAAARNWLHNWREGLYGKTAAVPRTPPAAAFDPSAPNAHTGGIPEAGGAPPATPPATQSASRPDTDKQKPSA